MLDQLIESTSHAKENRKRGGYLLTTLTLIFSLFMSGIMWSMFAKELGIGDESLELSELVAPTLETAPPLKQEMPKQATPQTKNISVSDVPTRKENIQSMNETPVKVPTDISTAKNNSLSRPAGPVKFTGEDSNPISSGPVGRNNDGDPNGSGLKGPTATPTPDPNDIEPPKIKKPDPTPTPTPKNPGIVRSSEVLNGKAVSLPKPPYPQAAISMNISGEVNVQVTIDENGKVISARAATGHPILRGAAENAARNARFSPTTLNGQPVKVTGLIIYKFSR